MSEIVMTGEDRNIAKALDLVDKGVISITNAIEIIKAIKGHRDDDE